MACNYSTKDFFRQMSPVLLARYFERRGIFGQFDFRNMKEGKSEALFAAWLDLSERERHVMDADFVGIFEMSSEKGWTAIRDEAHRVMRSDPARRDAFIAAQAALPNHFHRAMVTFLDHPELWKGATRYFHADSLSYWRKRKNMGHLEASTNAASLRYLADGLRTYFRLTEGRGNNCLVETFRRGDLDYYFAYPEDYSQQTVEWVDGQFSPRPHTPAFEVIYVYSQKDGSLDVNFRGNKKALANLQGIFANAILKLAELPPDPKDERVYDLSSFLDRGFTFNWNLGSGIQSVALKKLRLDSLASPGDRITLETDAFMDPLGIHAQLDQLRRVFDLQLYEVSQVELATSVMVDPDKPAKSFPIRITWPNSCSLKYDEVGLKLRVMLEASGIEPREPVADQCMAD